MLASILRRERCNGLLHSASNYCAGPSGVAAAATASPTPQAAPAAGTDDVPEPSVRAELRRLFSRAIAAAFPDASAEVALVPCANPKFGDYQCNNAMAIFGRLKGSPGAPKNPRAVAQAILDALDAPSIDLIDETSYALPLAVHLSAPRLGDCLAELPTEPYLHPPARNTAHPKRHAGNKYSHCMPTTPDPTSLTAQAHPDAHIISSFSGNETTGQWIDHC